MPIEVRQQGGENETSMPYRLILHLDFHVFASFVQSLRRPLAQRVTTLDLLSGAEDVKDVINLIHHRITV